MLLMVTRLHSRLQSRAAKRRTNDASTLRPPLAWVTSSRGWRPNERPRSPPPASDTEANVGCSSNGSVSPFDNKFPVPTYVFPYQSNDFNN